MKIEGATIQDGRMCAQLLNFLKVCKAPDGMKMEDIKALNDTLGWFNEFVKGVASDLQGQNDKKKAAAVPMPIIPEKKKKLGKIKGKK